MSNFFTLASKNSNKTTTPITLILCSEYKSWLEEQPQETQTWLNSNHYDGKGYCILPKHDGSILQVIYGISGEEGFFVAGDLAVKLPSGQYFVDEVLSAQALLPTSTYLNFLISWGLSCYSFAPYKTNKKAAIESLATLCVESQTLIDEATSYKGFTEL